MKNKIPEVDQAMNIYKKYMSDEEYKDYIETRELMAEMDQNERLAEAKEEGLAEGEINAKIEAVCKLVTKYKADIDEAIKDLGLDSKYKTQVLEKLKELEG